jgi:hypothetical protein
MTIADQKKKRVEGTPSKKINIRKGEAEVKLLNGNNTMIAQVVGIIIGSPEFQRR